MSPWMPDGRWEDPPQRRTRPNRQDRWIKPDEVRCENCDGWFTQTLPMERRLHRAEQDSLGVGLSVCSRRCGLQRQHAQRLSAA